jgi:hypothetical protein
MFLFTGKNITSKSTTRNQNSLTNFNRQEPNQHSLDGIKTHLPPWTREEDGFGGMKPCCCIFVGLRKM